MICWQDGPTCKGHVRQFMNYKACLTHTPAKMAGHPEPPTPPERNATVVHLEQQADSRAALVQRDQEKQAGMVLLRQAAEANRDQAMAQVDGAASDEWKDAARRAVWWLANNRATFTVDDVWELLEHRGVSSPAEPRALGPILMRAMRSGAIRDTGTMAKSRRRNASKITVYALQPKEPA